jgi:predicted MFS family arabinose efflux permease
MLAEAPALGRRPLHAVLLAEIISTTGSHMTLLALPWLVLETTGSPARMSLVVAADVAPVVLLSVPGGVLAARLGARRTMLGSDLARAALTAAIPLLYAAGALSFPLLVGLVFLQGMFWAPYYATQGALLPHLLGDQESALTRGFALFQSSARLTYFVGPALGGVLIANLGPVNVLWVDAVSYLVACAVVALHVPPLPPVLGSSGPQPWSGIRLLLRDPFLRGWTAAHSLSQMAYQTLMIALPLLAFARYGQSPAVAGLLVSGLGAGALLGSLAALRTPSRWPPMLVGVTAWLAQALVLWLLVVRLPVAAVMAILVLSGLANGLRVPPLRTVITRRIPQTLRVQALAAETALPFSAGLLAVVLAGPAAQAFGVSVLLAACASVATAGAVGFVVTVRGDAGSGEPRR